MRILARLKSLYRVATKLGLFHAFRLLKEKVFGMSSLASNYHLSQFKEVTHVSADALIRQLHPLESKKIENLESEYAKYLQDFEVRQVLPRKDFFDSIFDLGKNLSKFLYFFIRLTQPSQLVETGVAAGASTNTLLFALRQNGVGSLASIDVTPKVGELIQEDLKSIWQLHVISLKNPAGAFLEVLDEIDDAVIFLHDSDHSLEWQIHELDGVRNRLKNCRFVAFDDVSPKFIEYVSSTYPSCKVYVFDENRKFSAVLHFE
jgi:predicted O-methyltransferase YrrM